MKYWNAINLIYEFGPANTRKLYRHFNTMQQAWKAGKSELAKAGLESKLIIKLLDHRQKINPDAEFKKIKKLGIKLITIKNKHYPKLLKKIPDPPPLLYYLGELPDSSKPAIAVVGSRKYSQYGRLVTQKLVRDLAQYTIQIISGLAIGIDTFAHKACLESRGGTFAILPCGLDEIYPPRNRKLGQKIIENGGIISEMPLGWKALKQNFYGRNRIISGLCLGVLVIEAGLKSGTLITAHHAVDQNREVFAIPGNILEKTSVGNHKLIQEGAKLTLSAKDILQELNLPLIKKHDQSLNKETSNSISRLQQEILKNLSGQPISIDKLVSSIKLETNVLLSNLTEMEMEGLVASIDGGYYRI